MYNLYKYEALKAKEIADLNSKMISSPLNAENPFKGSVTNRASKEFKLFNTKRRAFGKNPHSVTTNQIR